MWQLSEALKKLIGDQLYKEAWKQIDIISGRKAKSINIIDADSEEERRQKFITHFKKLLSPEVMSSIEKVVHDNVFPQIQLDYNTGLFSLKELDKAVASLSNNKAAGVDGMVNEVLKLSEFRHILLQILNGVFITKVVPMEWLMSILVPVFKKGTLGMLTTTGGLL